MRTLPFLLSILLAASSLAGGENTRPPRRDGRENRPARTTDQPDVDDTQAQSTDSSTEVLTEYTRIAESFAAEDDEEMELIFHRCKNIHCTTLRDILEDFITPSGTVSASEESDIVVINDVKSNIPLLQKISQTVDVRVPQVLVEAQIVELTLDSDFEKEVNLAFEHISPTETSFIKSIVSQLLTPGANPTSGQGSQVTLRPYVRNYPSTGKRNELALFLRYLETRGKARILSAPNLVLRRGSEGSITTGEEVPILQQTVVSGSLSTSTVFKSVGIKMKVKPTMINEDTVRLEASPEVSTVTGFTSTGEGGVSNPIIAVRKATTELEVKDGQLISIGGLLRSEERTTRRRVPVAGSIPVLGHLFRSTREESVKTQLVIFLHIKILKEAKPNDVTVFHPADVPQPVQAEIDLMQENVKTPDRHPFLRDMDRIRRDGREQ